MNEESRREPDFLAHFSQKQIKIDVCVVPSRFTILMFCCVSPTCYSYCNIRLTRHIKTLCKTIYEKMKRPLTFPLLFAINFT